MLSSFLVIGDVLAWRVGNGNHLHVGSYPWPGSDTSHLLPDDLIIHLHRQDITHLSNLADNFSTTILHQGWKRARFMGLTGNCVVLYENYIAALQRGHIHILDMEDELFWKKYPLGYYTPKYGYVSLNIDLLQKNPSWWWGDFGS